MLALKLKEIRKAQDVKDLELGFILEDHRMHEIRGAYADVAGSQRVINTKKMHPGKVRLVVIVHGHLWIETAEVYFDDDGECYITYDEFDTHF